MIVLVSHQYMCALINHVVNTYSWLVIDMWPPLVTHTHLLIMCIQWLCWSATSICVPWLTMWLTRTAGWSLTCDHHWSPTLTYHVYTVIVLVSHQYMCALINHVVNMYSWLVIDMWPPLVTHTHLLIMCIQWLCWLATSICVPWLTMWLTRTAGWSLTCDHHLSPTLTYLSCVYSDCAG